MTITKNDVALKVSSYMNQVLTREELIDWCENQMQEGNFESVSVRDVVARIGVMDAKNFEISFEGISSLLDMLGYHIHVEVTA